LAALEELALKKGFVSEQELVKRARVFADNDKHG